MGKSGVRRHGVGLAILLAAASVGALENNASLAPFTFFTFYFFSLAPFTFFNGVESGEIRGTDGVS